MGVSGGFPGSTGDGGNRAGATHRRRAGEQSGPGRTIVAQARAVNWTDWPTEQLADFVVTILVPKLPKLSREEIQTMLELIDTDLKQIRFYQEVFAERRQKESVQMSLRLLRRRFETSLVSAHE